jgi:hypothetical protein
MSGDAAHSTMLTDVLYPTSAAASLISVTRSIGVSFAFKLGTQIHLTGRQSYYFCVKRMVR